MLFYIMLYYVMFNIKPLILFRAMFNMQHLVVLCSTCNIWLCYVQHATFGCYVQGWVKLRSGLVPLGYMLDEGWVKMRVWLRSGLGYDQG